MAEVLPSSFKFNATETVDSVFSKLLIANLFKDQTFKAGVTFTDKYNERGGQIYVRKLGKTKATKKNATQAGGLDLTHTETADKLLLIQKKDVISRSEKCYDLVESLRASGKSIDKVSEVIEEFKEGCQELYMSYLLAEPVDNDAVVMSGATRSANTVASTTLDELVASILADKKVIRTKGGKADTVIINPDMENLFLASALKAGNAFVPETNEEWLKSGKIGKLYGMNVFSSNLIGDENEGTAANTEYIIYDHETFALACDIEGLRMVNAIDFFGSYAQIESLNGGGVANPDLAIAKVVAPVVAQAKTTSKKSTVVEE